MQGILVIIGYILLWASTDVGRKKEDKIKFFSGNWWLIFILILSGTFLISKYMQ